MSANINVGVPGEKERYLARIQQFARDIDQLANLAMAENET